MAFSSALVLTDLDDFISPSQACIKPVEVQKSGGNEGSTIKVDDSGKYFEVTQDGGETQLQQASITLNDCLACSGCITSAESILVSLQSHEELIKVLNGNKRAIEHNIPAEVKTVVVSLSPQSRASLAAKYHLTPLQIHQKLTHIFKSEGVYYVFDTAFSRDISLVENAKEFVSKWRKRQEQQKQNMDNSMDVDVPASTSGPRVRRGPAKKLAASDRDEVTLPMLASSCPGWICYAEKTHGYVLPYISKTKSPQQMMGSIVKDFWAQKIGRKPNDVYHVAIMPCFDKKLEASRQDFYDEEWETRDVDCVITTGEVEKLLEESGWNLQAAPEGELDKYFTKAVIRDDGTATLMGTKGTSSGGYLDYIMTYAARELFGINVDVDSTAADGTYANVQIKTMRNSDMREVTLIDGNGNTLLKFAAAYGFRNIQNLVRKIKTGRSPYDFVEVMACPSGCINGGGQALAQSEDGSQLNAVDAKAWIQQVEAVYKSVGSGGELDARPEDNQIVHQLYHDWLGGADSEKARHMLHTQYHAVTQTLQNPLAVKW
ncbi:hypothetical protein BZG36_01206 [Bifiguratus adelaidae]|uniref:Iron hydrogenase small subunit domain-containing protein n=1 Tax=Bifiguratus adelaidae TaxID=1938954 RepID=A0A261Y5N3_9FUNG|nr:hypothetical protein BZG36_01206 [Bifiguratus adelaidae]